MILEVDEDVFQAGERRLRVLFDALVDAPLSDHHALLAPDDSRAVDAWLDAQGGDRPTYQQVLDDSQLIATLQGAAPAVQRGAFRVAGPLRVRVIAGASSDWPSLHLTLADALDLLREPLHLLTENRRHDLPFIRWLALPLTRIELLRLQASPGGLVATSGGGGEIKAHLGSLRDADVLSPEQLRRLWRTVVFFDRDTSTTDATQPSSDCVELASLCEEVYARHHVPLTWICLQRREIESYLPDLALQQRYARHSVTRHLTRWRTQADRQAWAWAFDLKKGLLGDLAQGLTRERRQQLRRERGQVPQPHELKAPFDQLDAHERRDMVRGYGEDVLNAPLSAEPAPGWLAELGVEYDRGPIGQIPRDLLIQSIFDRA